MNNTTSLPPTKYSFGGTILNKEGLDLGTGVCGFMQFALEEQGSQTHIHTYMHRSTNPLAFTYLFFVEKKALYPQSQLGFFIFPSLSPSLSHYLLPLLQNQNGKKIKKKK